MSQENALKIHLLGTLSLMSAWRIIHKGQKKVSSCFLETLIANIWFLEKHGTKSTVLWKMYHASIKACAYPWLTLTKMNVYIGIVCKILSRVFIQNTSPKIIARHFRMNHTDKATRAEQQINKHENHTWSKSMKKAAKNILWNVSSAVTTGREEEDELCGPTACSPVLTALLIMLHSSCNQQAQI